MRHVWIINTFMSYFAGYLRICLSALTAPPNSADNQEFTVFYFTCYKKVSGHSDVRDEGERNAQ